MNLHRVNGVILGFAISVGTLPAATRHVDLNCPTPTPPYTNWATAANILQDAADAAEAEDLILVTNGIYATGGRPVPGAVVPTNRLMIYKPMTVMSVNGPEVTVIEGLKFPGDPGNTNSIRCAAITNGVSLIGFTLRNGGSFNYGGGGVVGVQPLTRSLTVLSNCILTGNSTTFAAGAALSCTLIDCLITENQAGVWGGGVEACTVINSIVSSNWVGGQGGGASRSVLINSRIEGNSATNVGGGLSECTASRSLIRWNTSASGGGAQGSGAGCRLTDCILSENRALGGWGGAIMENYFITNCLVVSNSATRGGGLSSPGVLVNCTVVGNSAVYSGGIQDYATAYNTIIYSNHAAVSDDDHDFSLTLVNCCTPAASGVNIITNEPLFVNAAAGNFRLQSNSPGINAGANLLTLPGTDLEGNPRIAGGTVDMGAYEVQSPASSLDYFWAQKFGIPTDGSGDAADPDGDGHNNWQEWRADTIPTNGLSVLRLLSLTNLPGGIQLTWQSVGTRKYWLERRGDLGNPQLYQAVATNLPGVKGELSFTDASATNAGPYFYRVGVEP